ncbi:DUF6910 family protein [Nocardioides pantholopis]|uniref:DUF6910 family protein n=1 Tax=Nocardioides pantholopis TaxID=2483798 RepID=UPI0019D288FB|nr:hypothetical protein [Nocardioides pantholopis]
MSIEVMSVERLRFDDGAPVRAASAVVAFAGGFLVVPDDATHAAWFRGSSVTAVRLLPPTGGHELFSDATGTKHLKPDLEAACHLTVEGGPAALIMGSGSSPARMRWVLLRLEHDEPRPHVADMTPLYASVADALSLRPEDLNLEGVCVVGDVLRWYQRGLPSAGLPSGSVDLDLRTAVAAALGQVGPAAVAAMEPRTYDLGAVAGVGLAITDVVTLPDGTLLASAAAEDSPNPRDDGPVVASCLVRLDDNAVREVIPLPPVEDSVIKVEGLMVLEGYQDGALLLAVADVDDPDAASLATRVRVRF